MTDAPRAGGVILPPQPYHDGELRHLTREALDALLALWVEFATTGKVPDTETRAYVAQLIGRLGVCHE